MVSKLKNFYKFIEQIPDIILPVITLILIFECGHKLNIGPVKKKLSQLVFFAIIGVIITIIIIGIGVTSVFHVPFVDALLFGAILAATDPVVVGVIFKKFPIPYN
ncbi:MAG TPA: cation:proton antiporter [Nitrososphaeraceae archaeon]|nr:cation:proton antiporter [Nitrososphaeraceae archaeon]